MGTEKNWKIIGHRFYHKGIPERIAGIFYDKYTSTKAESRRKAKRVRRIIKQFNPSLICTSINKNDNDIIQICKDHGVGLVGDIDGNVPFSMIDALDFVYVADDADSDMTDAGLIRLQRKIDSFKAKGKQCILSTGYPEETLAFSKKIKVDCIIKQAYPYPAEDIKATYHYLNNESINNTCWGCSLQAFAWPNYDDPPIWHLMGQTLIAISLNYSGIWFYHYPVPRRIRKTVKNIIQAIKVMKIK